MLTDNKGRTNIAAYGLAVASIVAFGGVVAPVIEDKLGLGGECSCQAASVGVERGLEKSAGLPRPGR